jgi:hypothetical protein
MIILYHGGLSGARRKAGPLFGKNGSHDAVEVPPLPPRGRRCRFLLACRHGAMRRSRLRQMEALLLRRRINGYDMAYIELVEGPPQTAFGASAPCRAFQRRSPDRAYSRRSAWAAGTALYAPKPPSIFGLADRRGRMERRRSASSCAEGRDRDPLFRPRRTGGSGRRSRAVKNQVE